MPGRNDRSDARARRERQGGDAKRQRIPERHAVQLRREKTAGPDGERTVEGFAAHWDEISAQTNLRSPNSGAEQSGAILKAMQKVMGDAAPKSTRG